MDINIQIRGGARGITYFDRPISREIYERAQNNGGYVTREDRGRVLTDSELYGYGGSTTTIFEQCSKYYAHCYRYNSCD